jgi:multidrug efflux pump subunit AcrA (membrane-fusion protein)
MTQRIDVVCRHSSTALANAVEHQSLFLMPVWRAIGKSKFLVQARTLPKTVLIVLGLVVVVLALFLWPADFDLHAKGTLEPVDRMDVYADGDGQIAEFAPDADGKPIEHGSKVKKGQLLLRLRNPKLEVQKADIDGQVVSEQEHAYSLQHEISTGGSMLKPDEHARLMGQLNESQGKLESLKDQQKLVAAQLADLEVYSPIDGRIVTWDLKTHLENRPVQRGQTLLRVADTDGPWELELHMPDDRMGFILRQQNEVRKTKDPDLHVDYILATEPGKNEKGIVKEIKLTVEPEKEEGNMEIIRVAINKSDIDPANLREGAAASGKVKCGRRSLGYVWFHDLFSFLQTKVFFRFL